MSMTATTTPVRESELPRPASGFIIGPVCDSLFIIGAPLLALVLGAFLYLLPPSLFECAIQGKRQDLRQVFMLSFIEAHLVLVFFRSHGNPRIFREYPFAFVVVPIVLLIACALNPVIMGIVGVVAVWWDVYHSSLQTFGFGRIYDSKQKNAPEAGRSLDYWMNLALYVGPVLAGAHLVDHLESSRQKIHFL